MEIVYLDNHSRLPLVYGLDLYCSTVSGTVARNQPHHMCPTDGDAAALMDPCRTLDVSLGCEVGLVNEFQQIIYMDDRKLESSFVLRCVKLGLIRQKDNLVLKGLLPVGWELTLAGDSLAVDGATICV